MSAKKKGVETNNHKAAAALRQLRSKGSIEKDLAECKEFEILESEPDSYSETSSGDSGSESEHSDQPLSPKEAAKEQKKAQDKEQEIEKVEVGFKEFLACLDKRMLGYFFKSLILFFTFGIIIWIIFLIGVYFLSEDLWYQYFPVDDDSNVVKAKIEL